MLRDPTTGTRPRRGDDPSGRRPRSAGEARRPGSWERGQASVELVAIVPLVLIVALAVGQAVLAGYAMWTAAAAARAGARAEHVGGDPRAAARSALPGLLRSGARISSEGPIEVAVGAPALIPGAPALRVRASASLDPGADGG